MIIRMQNNAVQKNAWKIEALSETKKKRGDSTWLPSGNLLHNYLAIENGLVGFPIENGDFPKLY